MKKITVTESRSIMIDLLDAIAEFCDNNNLTYYLAYGTLLGAVRHKGYIPWDDDIDIMMPREDYEYFVKNFASSYEYIKISNSDTDGHHYYWAKIFDDRTLKVENSIDYNRCNCHGIDVDIFPMDKIPNDISSLKRRLIKNRALCFYYSMYFANSTFKREQKSVGWSLAYILFSPIGKIIGNKKLFNKFDKFSQKYNSYDVNKSDYIVMAFPKEVFTTSSFSEKTFIDFEGKQYSAPKDYDKVLTETYGDYMKLPPVERRQTHHDFEMYWK